MINAEPGGLGTIRYAEKGTLRLNFEIRTEGDHSAYLHRSKSATRIAAQLICELAKIEEIIPDIDSELRDQTSGMLLMKRWERVPLKFLLEPT